VSGLAQSQPRKVSAALVHGAWSREPQRNDTGFYPARSKYTRTYSRKYQQRSAARDAAEQHLVTRSVQKFPHGTVLDVPCGGGRISILLAQLGFIPTAADLSPAMVEIAAGNLRLAGVPGRVYQQDVEQLTFADRAFDGALCFRFFHHLPNDTVRARVIAELCRVTIDWVAISYFSFWSISSLRREWHRRHGRPIDRYATTERRLARFFAPHGFVMTASHTQGVLRALRLAIFCRSSWRLLHSATAGAVRTRS
jgi:SAM-dependent methyltransferase